MRKNYNAPECEIITLDNTDVITTSGTASIIDGDNLGGELELPEV